MRDQLSIATTNMRRIDADYERLNTKYQGSLADNQNLKDLNSQLKELLATYNNEAKKLREDFERRELDYQGKIAELNKALILQEKKMVDKVIESIDMKYQTYHNKDAEFDFVAKMDEEYDKLRNKRKEISGKLQDKPSVETSQIPKALEIRPKPAEDRPIKQIETIKPEPIIKPAATLPPTTKPVVQPVKPSTLPTQGKFSNAPAPIKDSPKQLAAEIDDFDDDFLDI